MQEPGFLLENIVKDKNEYTDFEGPLSLILLLLSKNKVEIRDINISEILDQYLEYLNKMQEMDLEIASEFVQMASHLVYIKTRSLLAEEKEISELEALIESLEQLQASDKAGRIKAVIPELKNAADIGILYYSKAPEPLPKTAQEYEYHHSTTELLAALSELFKREQPSVDLSNIQRAIPMKITYSIKNKSKELMTILGQSPRSLQYLYRLCRSRSEIVATFVSVLELCSGGILELYTEDDTTKLKLLNTDAAEIIDNYVE